MRSFLTLAAVAAILIACTSAQAATVYKITFDHGVMAPAPADYTAAPGEVLPSNVHGVLLNYGYCPDATRSSGNLINPDVAGSQGGQSLNMMLAGAWPNKQGYYFGYDPVASGNNYAAHTYDMGCPDAIGGAGPVIANEYTIEAVIKPNYTPNPFGFGLTNISPIFSSLRADGVVGGAELFVDQNTGTLTFLSGALGGYGDIVSNTVLQADTWYHIAVVVRPGATQRTELWVNGVLDGVGSYPLGWETQGLFKLPGYFTIGTDYWPMVSRNWQGQIDAVAISDKALGTGSFVLPIPSGGPQIRSLDFGKQWIRSHPFMVFGWSVTGANYLYDQTRLAQYKNCGMTSTLVPYPTESSAAAAKASGLLWQGQLWATSADSAFINWINAMSAPSDDNPWYLYDEPALSILPGIGDAAEWLRSNRPNSLIYLNVHYAYGDSGITTILDTVKPDLLMYDVYPFSSNGAFDSNFFFSQLMYFRSKTQARGIPLYSWMQCFTYDSITKIPSESQMRGEVFSSLAAGCKGLGYFMYDSNDAAGFQGLVHMDGSTVPQYASAADLNAEIGNLGTALRFLESTDVRFVPWPGGGAPSGLSNWSAGAGSDSHITNVAINPNQSYGNGLIGFFADDNSEKYFLLVNITMDPNKTSAETQMAISMTFDSSVDRLLRLNRETGQQEIVPLTNHVLNLTLPGGTGDLFKYDTGVRFTTDRRTVGGRVSLSPRPGDLSMVGVRIQFRALGSGTPLFVKTTFLDAAGNYVVNEVLPGVYDLAFECGGALTRVVPNITVLEAGTAQVNVDLMVGDVNGDNIVNAADHDIIATDFDKSGDN